MALKPAPANVPPMTDCDELAFFDFQATEKSASPRTLANYRDALAAYQKWRGEKFSGWRGAEADDFRDYLFALMKQGFKRATIRLRFAALRSFYKFLVLRRGMARSPVAEVLLPKPERGLPIVLTISQIDELLGMPLKGEPDKKSPVSIGSVPVIEL